MLASVMGDQWAKTNLWKTQRVPRALCTPQKAGTTKAMRNRAAPEAAVSSITGVIHLGG